MSVTLIQDLRWGDTGKGKISAALSHPDACDVSVRAVGGGNAGHVIQMGTRKMSLHLLPAGCVHEGVDVVLGQGMVTHLPTLLKEIQNVRDLFETDPVLRLIIAPENHLLFNGHKLADKALEERKGKGAVGTTGSGIGPAYADKALRVGMRMGALHSSSDVLKDAYRSLKQHWSATYGVSLSDEEEQEDIQSLLIAKESLERAVVDVTAYWQRRFEQQSRIVIEGAQGSLLSIDGEGYPYVTSSMTTTNGHLQGAGIPAKELTKVIGTLKAYDTRVGNGPMRTRMETDVEERFRQKGGEIGSTTGRKRNVGWLDAKDTRRRIWQESVTHLAILKGDIFDGESAIHVAIGSHAGGVPAYVTYPGWEGTMRGAKQFNDLPRGAQIFYKSLEEYLRAPVAYIGTGPENTELIELDQPA